MSKSRVLQWFSIGSAVSHGRQKDAREVAKGNWLLIDFWTGVDIFREKITQRLSKSFRENLWKHLRSNLSNRVIIGRFQVARTDKFLIRVIIFVRDSLLTDITPTRVCVCVCVLHKITPIWIRILFSLKSYLLVICVLKVQWFAMYVHVCVCVLNVAHE